MYQQKVARFIPEIIQRLLKPPLKFNGSLAKLASLSLVKYTIAVKLSYY